MYYCGIELSDRASVFHIIDEDGNRVREVNVETEEAGIGEALRALKSVHCVVEASPLAEWMKREVEELGHRCEIIDPRRAKALMDSQKKTDRRDARALALLAKSHWYRVVHSKSEQARLIRTQLKARQALVDARRAHGSTIRGLLKADGIKLGRVSEGAFAQRVVEVTRERCPQLLVFMQALVEAWSQALAQAKALKKVLEKESATQAVASQLRSVPGVGPVVSMAYMATIDDPWRFSNGEQVGDYLGLVPRVYQSGQTEYRGRITREGDRLLRALLVEAATVLLSRYQGDCALKRWGLGLAAHKGMGKARVAVARKLAVLLWSLWRRGERFDPALGLA